MYDLMLRQGRVADREGPVDIAIEQGMITRIDSRIDGPAKRELQLGGKLLQPGFVNPHLHPSDAFTWERAPNISGTLEEGVRLNLEVTNTFTPEDVRSRVRKLLNLGIRHGTTAVRTTVPVHMVEGLLEVDAVLDIAKEYRSKLEVQVGPIAQSDLGVDPKMQRLMRKAMESGCELLGGWPYGAVDRNKYVDVVFEIAKDFDVDIDIHIDYVIPENPTWENMDIVYLAQKTIEEGYQGRVTAGHVCALGSAEPDVAHRVIDLVKEAGISICTLPAQNLFMQGKGDAKSPRRGITRVSELLEAGVNVACGTDDVRNHWLPFGNADMLFEALMLAHVAQIGTNREQMLTIWEMATYAGARIMGIEDKYGIAEGKNADLVVFDAPSAEKALIDQAEKLYVFKDGKLTYRNQVISESYVGL